MTYGERYFAPAAPYSRKNAPKKSDAACERRLQKQMQRIENLRTHMQKIVDAHLGKYCDGGRLRGMCADFPVLRLPIRPNRTEQERKKFETVIRARLYALINNYLEDHKEDILKKNPLRTKKPREREAVFA